MEIVVIFAAVIWAGVFYMGWRVWGLNRGEQWDFYEDGVVRRIDGHIVSRGNYDEKKGHWIAYNYPNTLDECVFYSELDMLKFMKTAPPRPPKLDKRKELKAAHKQLKQASKNE